MSKNLKTSNLASFTFILITKNRFDIVNNINSFFNFSKVIDIRVIIIDGNKSDKIDRLIANNFKKIKK